MKFQIILSSFLFCFFPIKKNYAQCNPLIYGTFVSGEIDCEDMSSTVSLIANVEPRSYVLWEGPNNFFDSGDIVTAERAGLYTVTAINGNCTESTQVEVNFFNHQPPNQIQAVDCSDCSLNKVKICFDNIPPGFLI